MGLLAVAVRVYAIMVIVRVLFSWLPPQSRRNEVYLFLFSATEPLLGPLRRALPPAGGFDFSPLVAILILEVVGHLLGG
ncbi:MAG: YggT family protein [Candidatus Brocadiaceae bacterium]|nr:YggT family protein [Candidatus Brocadiaceae bacterium]